jgi:thioredoxin-like negative regulator of GroEL
MKTMYDIEELKGLITTHDMVVVYFSNESCNVCKVLKPRIAEMIAMQFPEIEFVYVDIEKSPVISGQYRVFTIPTIDVYVDGKEHVRFSRNVNMHELEGALRKPYDIFFPA